MLKGGSSKSIKKQQQYEEDKSQISLISLMPKISAGYQTTSLGKSFYTAKT